MRLGNVSGVVAMSVSAVEPQRPLTRGIIVTVGDGRFNVSAFVE